MMRGLSPARRTPRRDHGSVPVLEAILISLLMAGAIAFVLSFPHPTTGSARPVANLEAQAHDTMTILAGLDAPEGSDARNFLEAAVLEALQGKPDNLTTKVRSLLPEGADFNLYLDNGRHSHPLAPVTTPGVERLSVDRLVDPHWNGIYLYTGFSSYPTDAAVDVHGYPILNSVNLSAREAPLATLRFPNGWTTTMANGNDGALVRYAPPANGSPNGVPALANDWVRGNATRWDRALLGNASFSVTSHATLADTFAAMRAGLNASTLTAPRTPLRPGSAGTVQWDLSPVLTGLGGAADAANATTTLTLHSPIPNGTRFGGTLPAWNTTVSGASGTASLLIAPGSLLGSHLLIAETTFVVDGPGGALTQRARLATLVNVGLPNGQAVLAPAYRVVLETWFGEWA